MIVSVTKDGSPTGQENPVGQLRTVTLQCNAQNPNGDKLTYAWKALGGKIAGEGDTVGWISPGVPGDFTVIVTVTDSRGAKAETSIPLKVLCCGRTS